MTISIILLFIEMEVYSNINIHLKYKTKNSAQK